VGPGVGHGKKKKNRSGGGGQGGPRGVKTCSGQKNTNLGGSPPLGGPALGSNTPGGNKKGGGPAQGCQKKEKLPVGPLKKPPHGGGPGAPQTKRGGLWGRDWRDGGGRGGPVRTGIAPQNPSGTIFFSRLGGGFFCRGTRGGDPRCFLVVFQNLLSSFFSPPPFQVCWVFGWGGGRGGKRNFDKQKKKQKKKKPGGGGAVAKPPAGMGHGWGGRGGRGPVGFLKPGGGPAFCDSGPPPPTAPGVLTKNRGAVRFMGEPPWGAKGLLFRGGGGGEKKKTLGGARAQGGVVGRGQKSKPPGGLGGLGKRVSMQQKKRGHGMQKKGGTPFFLNLGLGVGLRQFLVLGAGGAGEKKNKLRNKKNGGIPFFCSFF